jgi:predicted transcriptional regulator
MRASRTRYQLFLPDDLAQRLETLAAKPGSSKSAILTTALGAWLDRRGKNELDDMFSARLDRVSRADERIERKLDFVAEALGTFVQHQLTLVAHQPPFEHETGQLGLKRYRAFIDMVGHRLARPDQSPTAIGMKSNEEVDG